MARLVPNIENVVLRECPHRPRVARTQSYVNSLALRDLRRGAGVFSSLWNCDLDVDVVSEARTTSP